MVKLALTFVLVLSICFADRSYRVEISEHSSQRSFNSRGIQSNETSSTPVQSEDRMFSMLENNSKAGGAYGSPLEPIEFSLMNFNVDSISRPGYPLTLELHEDAEVGFNEFLSKRGGIEMLAEIPENQRFADSRLQYPKRKKTLRRICAKTWKQFRLGLLVSSSIGFTGYKNKAEERLAWFTDMREWSPDQFQERFSDLKKKGVELITTSDRYRGCLRVNVKSADELPDGFGFEQSVEGKDVVKAADKTTMQENGFTEPELDFTKIDATQYDVLREGLVFKGEAGDAWPGTVILCNHYVVAKELMQKRNCAGQAASELGAGAMIASDPVSWLKEAVISKDFEPKATALFQIINTGIQPFSPLTLGAPDIVALEELDFLDVGKAEYPHEAKPATFGHALDTAGFDMIRFQRPVPVDEVAILWRRNRFSLIANVPIGIDHDIEEIRKNKKKTAGIVVLQEKQRQPTDMRVLLVAAAHLTPGDGLPERQIQGKELDNIKEQIQAQVQLLKDKKFEPYVVLLGDLNVDLNSILQKHPPVTAFEDWPTWDPGHGVPMLVDAHYKYHGLRHSFDGLLPTQMHATGGKRVDYILVDSRATVLGASSPEDFASMSEASFSHMRQGHPSDHLAVTTKIQIMPEPS